MLEFGLGHILRGDFRMAKKCFQAEQILGKLREAEVEISKGQTIGQIVKKLGVTEQTYHRWLKEYGSLRTDQAK
jgi:transposase